VSRASSPSTSRGTLRRVLLLFVPHRRRVLLLAATILAAALVGVGAPVLTKLVFDRALFPSSGHVNVELLLVLTAAMAVLIALTGVLGIVQTYLQAAVGQSVMHDLRTQLYRHLQDMSLRFFTGTRTGEIQSRLANDVGGVSPVVSTGVASIFANAAIVVTSLVAMALIAWELAALSVPILLLFAWLSIRVGRLRRGYSRSTQEQLAELSSITEETLSVSGALLGKVFDRHSAAVERYGEGSRRVVELRIREQMVGRIVIGLAQTFFLMAPALVYVGAGLAMANGAAHYTAGTLVAVTALQIRLYQPVRDLLDMSMQAISSQSMFERIFEYLDLPQELADSPHARTLAKADVRGSISFRDVWFRYGRETWTLANVTLDVQPGQLAALVGPTGAGKTTLSYLVSRLYDVERGSVAIDGIDVREIRLASLTDLIGVVTQETQVFHATIRDNLLYACPEATDDELEHSARLAFIHERIAAFPDGYDTVVGERGYRLSVGEKQRLAIARVLLKNPRILILDEATSALDTLSERLVQQALHSVTADRTTLAIAHRLSTILSADVIFVVDRGRIVDRGTHAELVARGGLYADLYRKQFEADLERRLPALDKEFVAALHAAPPPELG
jgi:ATP-binding cassette subfamily B protein